MGAQQLVWGTSSDCDAADVADDDDDELKSYYVHGIVGDVIRARLVVTEDKLFHKKSC